MCIATPGKIIEIFNDTAKVFILGIETNVNIQLIYEPKVGDYVIIHAGCAIEKIDCEYYDELSNIYKDFLEHEE